MNLPVSRRTALAGSLAVAASALVPTTAWSANASAVERLAALEAESGGRLGVAVVNAAGGRLFGQRMGERFPMCSTFKALAAAFVLAQVDRGEESLARRVDIPPSALVPWSPVVEKSVGGTMTVAALCDAAVTLSDNTAANLLLASLGGPAGLTAFLRALGDPVTRLDRIEPELNEARPGDPRDTTSPLAMAETLRKLLFEEALSEASRRQLAEWLLGTKTGDRRLRAGLPRSWRVGGKTGTGKNGETNDVAIVWPTDKRGPFLVSAYFIDPRRPFAAREAVLAEVGRIVAES